MLRVEVVLLTMMWMSGCLAMQGVTDKLRAANQTQFVAVLEQAIDEGLLDLSTGGPYTILAPTDDAFSRLTPEEMTTLTNDANLLSDVVKFHVIQGEVFTWDLADGRILHTLNGHSVRVYNTGPRIYVNNGHVVKGDLEANGAVLHLIDQVLDVPEGTIYAVSRNPQYPLSTFADYLDKVHLNHTLDTLSQHKYTVFAPSNDAFNNMHPLILERIQSSSYYLRELVVYHMHQGTLHLRSLDRNSTITTLDNGHTITITVDTDVHLNHVAELEQADIDCDNGVVHIIDHVLIPSTLGAIIG